MDASSDPRRPFTANERRYLLLAPVTLATGLAAVFFGFYRFGAWATQHFGVWNENAEQLVIDGRTLICTVLAGAIGAYLRVVMNLPAVRKLSEAESTFLVTIQIVSGGIVGFFLYVVVKSKLLLRVFYLGDISNIELNWEGAVALSLFAGLAAKEIVGAFFTARPHTAGE
jgi:hypothetical protein